MRWSHLLIVAGLFILCSCYKVDKTKIQNLNHNTILIFGHGGSGFKSWINYLPMNTLASIQQAIEESHADGSEMDLQMSADGQLIVFHDEFLQESTGCEGRVNELSSGEIHSCFYTTMLSTITGEKFPVASLEKILQHFSQAKSPPFLTFDLKLHPQQGRDPNDYLNEFAHALSSLLTKYNYTDRVFIESTSIGMLQKLKEVNPALRLFIYPAKFESGFADARKYNLYGITIRHNLINAEQVKQAHQNGIHVTLWGTRSKSTNREAILKNPDHIQTDNIENLTSLLN